MARPAVTASDGSVIEAEVRPGAMCPALSPWAYGRNRTWSLIALLRAFTPDKYAMRGSFELSRTGRGSIEIVECLNAAREKLTGPRAAPNPLRALSGDELARKLAGTR